MNKILLSGLLLALLLAWYGCSQNDDSITNPPESLEATWLTTLPNLVFQTSAYYPIQVQIGGVAPDKIDSVKAQILTSEDQSLTQFRLYDDAGAFQHPDAPDYCSPVSGDLVANNGIFSRLVNAHFAANPGTFKIQAIAFADGQSVQTPFDTIFVSESLPPQISGLILPDTLASGFPPTQISLQVIDPDAASGDSVASVQLRLFSSNGIQLGDPFELQKLGGSDYGLDLTADFAAGKITGDYIFAFRAWDTFNMESDSLGQPVYLVNLAPYLADTAVPDTVIRPSSSVINFPVTVRCWDDQTAADISQVGMRSLKPDGTWANGGNPFPLFDNGLPFVDSLWAQGYAGDAAAGDSIYTMTAFMDSSALLGWYHFYFKAQDLAGNEREIVDSLWVTP